MIKKSKTCKGKRTGEPLSEYETEYGAKMSADYINQTSNLSLVPYQCNTCGNWHLSPANRHTESRKSTCGCFDGSGDRKALYLSKEAAEQRAKIILEERQKKLHVYECPTGEGWHLTKG